MIEEWIVMRTKINEALESVLKQFDEKYFIDRIVNKSKVIQDLDTYDEELLTAFLSNEVLKDNFTIDIAGNTVLQTNKLIDLLEADEYWQDSYTKYSKKIGLTAGGKFIDENEDVVLDFPYKDTILKANMSKEDTDKDDLRPDEPFLNEVIAKEEIDVLLDKKILVNAKKYDENGEHEVDSFDENDNLIIKGNNLLALHTLKEKYAGKVKLIYIDPPYNTGNDSFNYNDKFNHSSWLTFMKNRIEIIMDLLSDDGIFVVQCDDNEQAYLKVLLDGIFGRQNFMNNIVVKMSDLSGPKMAHINKRFPKIKEYLLIYKKKDTEINPIRKMREEWDSEYKTFFEGLTYEDFQLIKNSNLTEDQVKDINRRLQDDYIISVNKAIEKYKVPIDQVYDFLVENSYRIARSSNSSSIKKELDKMSFSQTANLVFINGKYQVVKTDYDKDSSDPRVQYVFAKDTLNTPIGDIWLDINTSGLHTEGNVTLPNGKKPEKLLKQIIEFSTNERDLILDFFMGSSTTQAVAHKLNRRYIGIEQMDYIKDLSVKRLRNVIGGDQTGISKDVDWQGGGSFVYAELMEKNKGFIDAIRKCETKNDIDKLFIFLLEEAEIDFRVDLEKVKDTLHELSLDDQKRTLFKIIEKNQLYYNYSEIDDENVRDLISDSDYKFNKSFYEGGE